MLGLSHSKQRSFLTMSQKHEGEDLAGLGNQPVSQINPPRNLKRCNPNSAEVEFTLLDKKGKLSVPRKNNTASAEVCTAVLSQGEPSLANTFEVKHSTLMGNDNMGTAATSSSLSTPLSLGIPETVETSLEIRPETINYPTSLGYESDQCSSSLSSGLLPNLAEDATILKTVKCEETSLENNGPDSDSSHPLPPDYGNREEINLENSTQMMHILPPNYVLSNQMRSETVVCPTSVENGSDTNANSGSFDLTTKFVLVPLEVLTNAGDNIENSCGITYFLIMENNNNQNFFSSSACIDSDSGFLGDPKRNVIISNFHLMAAKSKAGPKEAANYLFQILYPKEVPLHSSTSSCPLLDSNKIDAIREFLETAFPNHKLHECGKDWSVCMADINSLIHYSCHGTNITPGDTALNSQVPTNLNTPASAGCSKHGDGGESSYYLPQLAASGNSQQNSIAVPEEFMKDFTDDSKKEYDDLAYVGHPRRNIQLPVSVLKVAKRKSRPDLSARYLVRHLFQKQTLIQSNVNGNVEQGIPALNPNKISAIREFLQENFQNSDLSERGFDWRLCVSFINRYIRSVRYETGRSLRTSQIARATTPSTNLELEHTDN